MPQFFEGLNWAKRIRNERLCHAMPRKRIPTKPDFVNGVMVRLYLLTRFWDDLLGDLCVCIFGGACPDIPGDSRFDYLHKMSLCPL